LKQLIVIGGGAAGFFAAINAAIHFPQASVQVFEKSGKLLSKVRISGGGRCNVTHHCFDNAELVKHYPRGEKELRQVFARFSVQDTIDWFAKRGVELKTEADGRMFPVSNSSETIIECLLREADRYKVQVRQQVEVLSIHQNDTGLVVTTNTGTYTADAVICAAGGHAQGKHYQFIKDTGHAVAAPIPSLFTLNLPGDPVRELMGLSVKQATVRVQGTKHQYTGPVLITHWGLSGPAVLKLSAFAAADFFNLNYHAPVMLNWTGQYNEDEVRQELLDQLSSKALVMNTALYGLPRRLWEFLVHKAGIPAQKTWAECGKKDLNKLAQLLTADVYQMQGKTTFKEEFVTCGGVSLKEIDFKTMQSRVLPGLYFCGEVLNIDGITGGFNFQNAWSTAWIASQLQS